MSRLQQIAQQRQLVLKNSEIEFHDYYWEKSDYLDCFEKVGLKILQIYSPLGSLKESYRWEDELSYSPFIVFIAKKTETESKYLS